MSEYYKCCGCPKFENNEHCDDEIIFCEHELAEHDAKIRAEAIDEFENWLHKRILRTIPIEYDELVKVLEQIKEQKNE